MGTIMLLMLIITIVIRIRLGCGPKLVSIAGDF